MARSADRNAGNGESGTPAAIVLEELARRCLSRQQLAEQARISLSTLEKALSGRRPFTLATLVRIEQALGVSLREKTDAASTRKVTGPPELAPDELGSYTRAAVSWIEGAYLTIRPSFGDKTALYTYRTEILWDAASSSLVFRESERIDAAFSQQGFVSVPNFGPHLSRHQRARTIPAHCRGAAEHQRGDAWHLDHTPGRAWRTSHPRGDADCARSLEAPCARPLRPNSCRPRRTRPISRAAQAYP
jgi:transcriptional regulator with XRE-family HTH domain